MVQESILEKLILAIEWVRAHRGPTIKIAFLVAMMLLGHHRGLIHIWPVKIPIAHGLNQILGAVVYVAIGVLILALTNKLLGW